MSRRVTTSILCLLLALFAHSQGLQFAMTHTPGGFYCGYLRCVADTSPNDPHISTIIGLTIYDVTETNVTQKLASVTPYSPGPDIEPNVVHIFNATGSLTRYHSDMTISFRETTSCLYGSFLCEMFFVDVSGQSDVTTEMVTITSTGTCASVEHQYTELTSQLKAQSENLDRKLAEVNSKLDSLLNHLSINVGPTSSSTSAPLTGCYRGMPHTASRQKFLLWGQINALCDTETDGGGWVIIQRRTTGDIDFYRPWHDYQNGFGTTDTDFWIGLSNIHNLTLQGFNQLRIDMVYQGIQYYAEYSQFRVGSEVPQYDIIISGYTGTAGDALSVADGVRFSTHDNSNGNSCAASNHGGWWYTDCKHSNLNGEWGATGAEGMTWSGVVASGSVRSSEMKVRRL